MFAKIAFVLCPKAVRRAVKARRSANSPRGDELMTVRVGTAARHGQTVWVHPLFLTARVARAAGGLLSVSVTPNEIWRAAEAYKNRAVAGGAA